MTADPIIVSFRCRTDNVGVVIHDPETGATAAVDAPQVTPILEVLGERGWRLTDILVTHHHQDHVDGIPGLRARFDCRVVGPKREAERIGGIDLAVSGGDRFSFGGLSVAVLDLPGHTNGHVGYHFVDAGVVFVGDTLFENGSGRLLEGTPEDMWASLSRLRELPASTVAFYGHDYGVTNGRFALTVDPDNARLAAVVAEATSDQASGRFRAFTTIGREMATNPFMRADDPAVAAAVGLAGRPPAEVLGEVRARKNRF